LRKKSLQKFPRWIDGISSLQKTLPRAWSRLRDSPRRAIEARFVPSLTPPACPGYFWRRRTTTHDFQIWTSPKLDFTQ